MDQNLTETLSKLMPMLPPEAWWLPGIILVILGGTAVVDAWSGRVPDAGTFTGLMISLTVMGLCLDWETAAGHLLLGFVCAFAIYGINQLYYNWRKQDAIGMGDAKWTALAAMNFGWKPVAVAWGLGAWIGLFWMLSVWVVSRLNKNKVKAQIHFAPFLFLGLLVGLWWFELRV